MVLGFNGWEYKWTHRAVGMQITEETWEKFVAAGNKRREKNAKRGAVKAANIPKRNHGYSTFFDDYAKREAAAAKPVTLTKEEFLNDPLIKSAMNIFRATIVEVRHDPPPTPVATPIQPKPVVEKQTPRQTKANQDFNFVPKKTKEDFYSSDDWKDIRMVALRRGGYVCAYCLDRKKPLHVDHIVPLSVDWSRRLDLLNLQVLCADCNQGKRNYHSDDASKIGET